ncbi:MAG: cyclohexa-1,5-dienecarbonyl-CoA hydratase [Rhodospirillales bacterium]|jgi:cyclohexa-1,5-dienecarbonyl-CoA hydratase|nr:cyclohexa-1,5-dienecarbonyl-CoA hydratase [Rhodospirillales bacterium]MDP6775069.1 cyclohexa-1,5-dienecarbonyl-CoA hydratase [Rhodospirillales bacterium]
MSKAPLKVWFEREGKLLRLRLARPKANVFDFEMIAAVDGALAEHLPNTNLIAVLLDHEGPHFSFGASIEEHLPEYCAIALRRFHDMLRNMLDSPLPILVAVRGHCLGGGLEVACAANFIFAAPDSTLGQPEIRLGVFAPAASSLLPARLGRAQAEDLLLSGRHVSGEQALAIGLVNDVSEDPVEAALAYFDEHLATKSASSLRFAMRAARQDWAAEVKAKLATAEDLYFDGLMTTRDAVEGLQSFIEKRPAKWENR